MEGTAEWGGTSERTVGHESLAVVEHEAERIVVKVGHVELHRVVPLGRECPGRRLRGEHLQRDRAARLVGREQRHLADGPHALQRLARRTRELAGLHHRQHQPPHRRRHPEACSHSDDIFETIVVDSRYKRTSK